LLLMKRDVAMQMAGSHLRVFPNIYTGMSCVDPHLDQQGRQVLQFTMGKACIICSCLFSYAL
jgi:hypothetical protein